MNNTDYQNLIKLLKKTLEFYADKDNYPTVILLDNNENTARLAGQKTKPIEFDMGHQARFALQKIAEMNTFYENINHEYLEGLKERIDKTDDIEGIIKLMNEIENIKNIITNKT